MYRRLFIISAIIFLALIAFGALGFHSISLHAEGLAGKRSVEFAEVANQIQLDVKQKLDQFIRTEQKRPYTDYQYFYTPEALNVDNIAIIRSPLAKKMEHGLAYGHFQIQPDSSIISPFYITGGNNSLDKEKQSYISNIKDNVITSLNGRTTVTDSLETQQMALNSRLGSEERSNTSKTASQKEYSKGNEATVNRGINYDVQNWEDNTQTTQVVNQSRRVVYDNIYNSASALNQSQQATQQNELTRQKDTNRNDMVQIRIEPFVPIVVPHQTADDSFFDGQVFLLRHVQIENNHFRQGFKLDETKLIEQVRDSARALMRTSMGFELSKQESQSAVHAAILDFGFGQIVLNLFELNPKRIAAQISQLKNWYFVIVSIVLIATMTALASLWRSLHAQVCLARKKDDFISAVSHELRTPLTTIRMYTEMLENNWIKNDDQRREYYSTMRQESERLSRLIENVLDFSRIQRGRKTYHFELGNINAAIEEVVDMMAPYAKQHDFTLTKQFDRSLKTVSFDSDALMQIVINLLDNAIKYARNAEDRRIFVRTYSDTNFVIIEIEDHGPGIPHLQRKKIFDEFYRIGEEAKRETNGTGLGLALVKKFTQAHNGLVEVISAKPKGTIFRVALPATS